jgi:hypothetical protein
MPTAFVQWVRGDTQEWATTWRPAELAVHAGIYRCTACPREVTVNMLDRFPAEDHHQHPVPTAPIAWRLLVATNTSGVS